MLKKIFAIVFVTVLIFSVSAVTAWAAPTEAPAPAEETPADDGAEAPANNAGSGESADDGNNMILWIVIAGAAVIIIVIIVVIVTKKKN